MLVQGFESFGLDPKLLQGIRDMGFLEPFPIQAEAIGPLLKGRDLIGQAQTGSGKTLAYALPMLQRIEPHMREIQGLVLVPTRELASRSSDCAVLGNDAGRGCQALATISQRSASSLC